MVYAVVMAAAPLRVLIVDDRNHVLDALELLFALRGELRVVRANTPERAIEAVRGGEIGVVVQDMNFSEGTTDGEEGARLFAAIRQLDASVPVVLMTAWGSLQAAVELVKQGADDYLQKPWDDDALLKKVVHLMRARRPGQLEPQPARDLRGLVFESAAMHAVVSLAVKVAASNVSVLVTGPNGSGKEKIAEVVQANSTRSTRPFVKVNVGALPDELFVAEIFGAEAGAYTGARTRRQGRFEAAHGGTLFLDEIGNLSLGSQAKLLRALQSGEFERLGSSETHAADVRVIAATNVDLKRAIASGQFRQDLYYRLAVVELAVPALAERVDDVVPLAHALLQRHGTEGWRNEPPSRRPAFGDSALAALAAHDWPGNVRELENCVRRGLLLAEGSDIEAGHLGLGTSTPRSGTLSANSPATALSSEPALRATSTLPPLDRAERQTIERALNESSYVVSKAAGLLGLSRQALYRRMQRLGLKVRRDVAP